MTRAAVRSSFVALLLVLAWLPTRVHAQLGGLGPAPVATQPAAQNEAPRDLLGRETPRGTVLGFMGAARRGNDEAATMYLDTTLKGQPLADLAHQLYIVLDSRLPARLNELSDRPEGALANPLKPDLDVVGTINSETGPLDIVVERVTRDKSAPTWLFSAATLEAIPAVYREVDRVTVDRHLPGVFRAIRIGGIRLFEWITLLVIIPAIYRLLGLAIWLMRPMILVWRRRSGTPQRLPITVPGWIRLILLAMLIRWAVTMLDLPLLERQFWATIATLFVIIAGAWMLVQLNAYGEYRISRRFHGSSLGEVTALLRLGRHLADLLVIALGVLVAFRFFGFDPTAALAGLGIGGIAVALAAQKTLENVIGGLSIVFDKAVKVGDFMKFGDAFGTVDSIGLRSTRIRTLDRTLLSVPNGQIANAGIETLSARDMFWFHHYVGLAYSTTPVQMRTVIDNIQKMLNADPAVDRSSSRARFLRFSPSTLDIEVFAYVYAPGWERFLEIQQEFLLTIMEIVERAGTSIALPSQTLFVADSAGSMQTSAATARLIPSRDH